MAEITTIVVGNIGSGKTTFLNSIEERKVGSKLLPLLELPGEIKTVKESPEVLNIVDKKFYPTLKRISDPQLDPVSKEMAQDILFAVELDILNERIKQLQATMRQGGIVFNERCPYEDRYVFVANLYRLGYIRRDHYEIYEREYAYRMKPVSPPDLLIYLYTKPETAFRRRMEELKRGTGGLKSEVNLTLDYITSLHELYEEMINKRLADEIPDYSDVLLVINADKDFSPEEIIKFHNFIEERAYIQIKKKYRKYRER